MSLKSLWDSTAYVTELCMKRTVLWRKMDLLTFSRTALLRTYIKWICVPNSLHTVLHSKLKSKPYCFPFLQEKLMTKIARI
jgi:hypothetical protein